MADIRIKDLPTTATQTSSDDFIALDGTTNGTRKLSAYNPSFGGAITGVSLTAPTTTNLTLAGGSTGASLVLGQGANASATIATTGSGGTSLGTGATQPLKVGRNSDVIGYTSISFNNSLSTNGLLGFSAWNGADTKLYIQHQGSGIEFRNAGATVAFLNGNGNLLIGTTTDVGPRLLSKTKDNSYTGAGIGIVDQNSGTSYITRSGGTFYISNNGSTDHFTLSSTGAATFAGAVTVNSSITAGTGSLSLNGSSGNGVNIHNTLTSGVSIGAVPTVVGILSVRPVADGIFNFRNAAGLGSYTGGAIDMLNDASNTVTNLTIRAAETNFIGVGATKIASTTPSTGAGSGALQVAGGIYAGAASVFGGTVSVAGSAGASNTLLSNVTGYNAISFNNNVTVGGIVGIYAASAADNDLYISVPTGRTIRNRVNGSDVFSVNSTAATFAGAVTVNSTTAASSTTSGALQVSGGVGVGGAGYFGGTLSSSASTNGDHYIVASNSNAGTSAQTNLYVTTSGGGSEDFYLRKYGFNHSTRGHQAWLGTSGGLTTLTLAVNDVSALSFDTSRNATFAGAVLNSNGTAAAPSISFAADSDTGFYRYGDNAIGIASQGAYRFRFELNSLYGPHGSNNLGMDSNGACSLSAAGTNQNITLTPSGTGRAVVSASGTGDTNGALNIVASSQSAFLWTQANTAPNITTGQIAVSFLGKSASSANSGYMGFLWNSNSSTTNGLTWGLYGVDRLMTLLGTGNLLIGTTTDGGQKLQVNGTASFGGGVTVPFLAMSTDAQGSILSSVSNTLNIDAAAGDIRVRPKPGSAFIIGNSAGLRLGNAYVAGAVVGTGYVTIQDSTGTTYRVPVLI